VGRLVRMALRSAATEATVSGLKGGPAAAGIGPAPCSPSRGGLCPRLGIWSRIGIRIGSRGITLRSGICHTSSSIACSAICRCSMPVAPIASSRTRKQS
jgi:hypothetical protein